VHDGWVDLREPNCERWIERARAIEAERASIPEDDSSSRYLRHREYWHAGGLIEPGKTVGWILSVEERGARIKR
jgi:hypothetical protein